MDKVQIYFLVTSILNFLLTLYAGVIAPEKATTNRDRLLYYPVSVALMLPIIGRLYGWW